MRNYLILTRTLLKTGANDLAANMGVNKKKKKSSAGMIVLWIIVGICMIPYLGMLFAGSMGLTVSMALIGREGLVLDLILLAGSMVTLVFGVTYVLSFFYMTNDMETLLPLPLSPWQILGAKFTVVFLYECATNLLLIGPALLGHGIAARWGVLNWLLATLQFLILPVVPLVYAAILSILLMRIFRRFANRNFVSVVSTVLILVVVMVFSSFGSSMGSMEMEELTALISQGGNSLAGVLNLLFPLLSFASKSVTFASLLDLLIVLAGNAVSVVIFLLVGQKLYFSGVIGMNETSSKRKAISLQERKKLVRGKSVLSACISKEWKLLVRTPVYFLNCALFPLIWPVFFLIPVIVSLVSNGVDLEMGMEAMGGISSLAVQEALQDPFTVKIVLLVIFGITVFIASMGFVSGTALSREGQGFIFMKYVPVPYRTQLLAKLSVGTILTVISTTGYSLVALIVMMAFGFPPAAALLALLISLGLNGIINLVDLGMDLVFPKLNWENEQMAVKQNMNTLLEMLITLVICGVLGVLYGVVMLALDLNVYAGSLILIVLLAAIDAGLYVLVMRYGEKRLASLE